MAESKPVVTSGRRSFRKVAVLAGVFFVALLILFAFSGAIINGYVKNTVEKAFAQAHPSQTMRIGHLAYSIRDDAATAESITVSGTNAIFKADRITLTGVRWISLLRSKPVLADVFAQASLDVTNLDAEFPEKRYAIRCARLQASVPGAELSAVGFELRSLAGDNDFFSAHEFRTCRFQLIVPECSVSGLAYGELFKATSYRAASIHIAQPSFDALVDSYKAINPSAESPLMVHEALAAILKPLQIDSLRIDNGSIKYSEQIMAGGDTGVLTFTSVSLSAQDIANQGGTADAITLQAQGNLMDAGTLKLSMSIPITPTNLALRYSGSLAPMNLTNLNAFLEADAHTRITSGFVKEADFEINVTDGQARGQVGANYQNLEIAFLDKKSGAANGIEDRVTSFLANTLKIRSANSPVLSGSAKKGEVNYIRKPNEEFQQFLWFALRTGVLDIISH